MQLNLNVNLHLWTIFRRAKNYTCENCMESPGNIKKINFTQIKKFSVWILLHYYITKLFSDKKNQYSCKLQSTICLTRQRTQRYHPFCASGTVDYWKRQDKLICRRLFSQRISLETETSPAKIFSVTADLCKWAQRCNFFSHTSLRKDNIIYVKQTGFVSAAKMQSTSAILAGAQSVQDSWIKLGCCAKLHWFHLSWLHP